MRVSLIEFSVSELELIALLKNSGVLNVQLDELIFGPGDRVL